MGPDVAERSEHVLRTNWCEGVHDGVEYAYTRPDPSRYPWQWYWDSCLAAIVWRRFDRARARAELETLLAAARPDGFIGHTIFWGRPVSRTRRVFYNVHSRRDFTTCTIQPPHLAWSWRIAVGDPADDDRIAAHHDWFARNRDLERDGLIWLLQPDESGLDASPQFDPIWGARAQGTPGFPLLVARNRRLDFDIRRVRAAGGPLVCSVLPNVTQCLSNLALGRASTTPALVDRLYDEHNGLFRAEAWPSTGRRQPVCWDALSPLALPDLPEAIGRRLVEEHLLDERRFWLPVPPPSVAANDPAFSRRDRFLGLRRYWRGPTWINAAWLVSLGMRRLGYDDEAKELARRLGALVPRERLREYYDPYSGRGMGARRFAWSTLILELTDPDPLAASSYFGIAQAPRYGSDDAPG
jgi:hypothetical protein